MLGRVVSSHLCVFFIDFGLVLMFSLGISCPLGDCCCYIHVCLFLCDLRAVVYFSIVEIWVVGAVASVTGCGDDASCS